MRRIGSLERVTSIIWLPLPVNSETFGTTGVTYALLTFPPHLFHERIQGEATTTTTPTPPFCLPNQAIIVPGLSGTSENGAGGIISNGFGVAGKIDSGYYGSGIYLTNRMSYASLYAKETELGKPFVVGLMNLGNPFPVTEHPLNSPRSYNGAACRRGYQSHFSVVDGRDMLNAFPLLEHPFPSFAAHEYVAFESSQLLPLFLVYSSEFPSSKSRGSIRTEDSKEAVETAGSFRRNSNPLSRPRPSLSETNPSHFFSFLLNE